METIQIVIKSSEKIEGTNNNATFKIPYRHYFNNTNQLYELTVKMTTLYNINNNAHNANGMVSISGFSNKTYKNFLNIGILHKEQANISNNQIRYEFQESNICYIYPPMTDYITIKTIDFYNNLFVQTDISDGTNIGDDMHDWILVLNFRPV